MTRMWTQDGSVFVATYDRRTGRIVVKRDRVVVVDTVVVNFNEYLRKHYEV